MATEINSLSLAISNTDLSSSTLTDNNSTTNQLDPYVAYVDAFKVSYQSTESPLITTPVGSIYPDPFSSLTASTDGTFSLSITSDGWYKFKYIAVPVFVAVTETYAVNDLLYDSADDNLYRCIQGFTGINSPNTRPDLFAVVTDPSTVFDDIGTASDPANIHYQEFDTIVRVNTNKAVGNAATTAALEQCGDCTRSEDVELYELLTVMLDGMAIADGRGLYVNGEKIARRAERLI